MTVFEMAKKYYPEFWNNERLIALVEAEKLTAAEYKVITGNEYIES